MSTRHFQRAVPLRGGDEDASSSEEEELPARKPLGGFAALLAGSDGSSSGGDDSSDDDSAAAAAAAAAAAQLAAAAAAKAGKSGGGKGARKTRGAAQPPTPSSVARARDDEDDAVLAAAAATAAAEACGIAAEGSAAGSAGVRAARLGVLAVDRRALDPEAEMTRLFGKRAIRAAAAEAEAEAAEAGGAGAQAAAADAPRRVQRQLRARHALQNRGARVGATALRARAKRCLLVQPAAAWPPITGGGPLEIVAVVPGGRTESVRAAGGGGGSAPKLGYYALRPKDLADSRLAASRFRAAVETGDPRSLLALLGRQPWHVPTLIALHRVFCQTGQMAEAADMAARALHACELGFSHEFVTDWLAGGARLVLPGVSAASGFAASASASASAAADSEEAEAGEGGSDDGWLLLRALWHHAAHLQRRGAHAAALSATKLCLSLGPTHDATRALLLLDQRCVRAGDEGALEALCADPVLRAGPPLGSSAPSPAAPLGAAAGLPEPPLRMLPGWAFSRALALFRAEARAAAAAEREAAKRKEVGATAAAAAAAAVAPTPGELTSGDVLESALLWFPMALPLLLNKAAASDPRTAPLLECWQAALAAAGAREPAAEGGSDGGGSGGDGGEGAPSLLLQRLLLLYAEQTADFWRESSVLAWVDTHTRSLADRLVARSAGAGAGTADSCGAAGGGAGAAGSRGDACAVLYACKRAREAAYPPGQPDLLRGSEFAELAEEARQGLIPGEAGAEALRVPEAPPHLGGGAGIGGRRERGARGRGGPGEDDEEGWELGADADLDALLANVHFGLHDGDARGGGGGDGELAALVRDALVQLDAAVEAHDEMAERFAELAAAAQELLGPEARAAGDEGVGGQPPAAAHGAAGAAPRSAAEDAAARASLGELGAQLGEEVTRALLRLDAVELPARRRGRDAGDEGEGDDDEEEEEEDEAERSLRELREWRRAVARMLQELVDRVDRLTGELRLAPDR